MPHFALTHDLGRRLTPESGRLVRARLIALLAAAPAAPSAIRPALASLLSTTKLAMDAAQRRPRVPAPSAPLASWEDLLGLLADIRADLDRDPACQGCTSSRHERLESRFNLLAKAHESSLLMIEIMYELINAGEELRTAPEVLEQSGDILMRELSADLYVCRLRRDDPEAGPGEVIWENIVADSADNSATPIFVQYMEESHPTHPVMAAVHGPGQIMHVLSNNLQAGERGGEAFDCTAYQEGYRARLTFILRDADAVPFGLVMLYSRRERYFDRLENAFLADCARLVSLTVERRLEVGRDALEKAAGGMAHVGNNALSVIKNCVELVIEELQAERAPLDRDHQIALLRKALGGVDRIKGAILRLGDAAENPVIMPYIRGEEVLDLEPPPTLPAVRREE